MATVEAYDPIANMWSSKADLLSARHSLMIVTVENRIYAIGGLVLTSSNNSTSIAIPSDTVEEYNPITDTWANKASKPTAGPGAACVHGGEIYTISKDAFEVYAPSTDSWRSILDLPASLRRTPSCMAINNRLYIADTGLLRSRNFTPGSEHIGTPSEIWEYVP